MPRAGATVEPHLRACWAGAGALDSARWEPTIRAFELRDRQDPPPRGGIVFVGSSSIARWQRLADDFPGLPVINRGFGGSIMADSAHYARRIVTPYAPGHVIVYAGENDVACGRTAEQVLGAFQALVEAVRSECPRATVTFVSIKPSPAGAPRRREQVRANELVRGFVRRGARLHYVDVTRAMLDEDGAARRELFGPDLLHMNELGYAVWRRILGEHLGRLWSPAASAPRRPRLDAVA